MFTSALLVKRFLYKKQMKVLMTNEIIWIDPPPKTHCTVEYLEDNLKNRPVVETSNSFRAFARGQWPWMSALCYHPNVSSIEGTDAGLEAKTTLAKEQEEYLTTKPKELTETRSKEHAEYVMKRDVLQGQNAALDAVLQLMDHAMEKKKSAIEQKDKRLVAIAGEIIKSAGKRENARYIRRNFKEQVQSLRKYLKDKKEEHQKKMVMLDKDFVDMATELARLEARSASHSFDPGELLDLD